MGPWSYVVYAVDVGKIGKRNPNFAWARMKPRGRFCGHRIQP